MTRNLIAFAAASTILWGGVAATAHAAPALHGWVDTVEAQIERRIESPAGMMGTQPSGVATVAFVRGEDGRAAQIRIARSSGSSAVDAAALRTVKRLRDLAPLPAGIDAATPVHVQLAFGDGSRDFQKRLAAMRYAQRDNNVRMAATTETQLAAATPR